MHGGYSKVYDRQVSIYFTDHWINIPIDRGTKNLSIAYNDFVSENKKWLIVTKMCSSLSHTRISKICFGDLCSINNLQAHGISANYANFDNEWENYYKLCGNCVGAPANKNITGTHKELLLCHWKLGVSM